VKRISAGLLTVFVLSLGSSKWLMAQGLSPEQFLNGVSAHPVGHEVERDQFLTVGGALNNASPGEVGRVLPALLMHVRSGNKVRERVYAAGFLLDIAIRPDGAELLSSKPEEISALLVDANPEIQNGAAAITDFVIAKAATNKGPYVAALEAAIHNPKTPQDVDVDMVGSLLYARFFDSSALKPVLDFVHRDDLTSDTRRELVHSLGDVNGLPKELTQFLVKELADPDPTVRATALVAYADSSSAFHTQGRRLVQKIANDPQEIPGLRNLAKDAVAGKTHLSPNYNYPPIALDPKTGAPVQ
jgi:hypothetical protein